MLILTIKNTFLIIVLFFSLGINAQPNVSTKTKSYNVNNKDTTILIENIQTINEPIHPTYIHQINLLEKNKFEFRNSPSYMCSGWKEFYGNYEIKNDTILFTEEFELEESDFKITETSSSENFVLHFKSKKGDLTSIRNVELSFNYVTYDGLTRMDFNQVIKQYKTDINGRIEIPINKIPNHDYLSYIEFSIFIDEKTERSGLYSGSDLPLLGVNIMTPKVTVSINILKNPKKENVTRKTIGILDEETIRILSCTTKHNLENLRYYGIALGYAYKQ